MMSPRAKEGSIAVVTLWCFWGRLDATNLGADELAADEV